MTENRSRQLIGIQERSEEHTAPPTGVRFKPTFEEEVLQSSLVPLITSTTECFNHCAFVVDAMSPDVTLVECTPSFTVFCGPMEAQGFAELIVSEKTHFLLWIQASVNALMCDIAATTLGVRLAPRHLRSHWEVHADLRAVSCDLGPNGEIFVAIVMFTESLVRKNRVRPRLYGLGTKRNMEFRSLDAPSRKGKRLRL
uniref:Uncharacterized protein n=1 Tax=Noctiluca scintillans TaxID=2966 RepID=A0A7S1A7Z2_NOCSC